MSCCFWDEAGYSLDTHQWNKRNVESELYLRARVWTVEGQTQCAVTVSLVNKPHSQYSVGWCYWQLDSLIIHKHMEVWVSVTVQEGPRRK